MSHDNTFYLKKTELESGDAPQIVHLLSIQSYVPGKVQ
jgi:hypothetical protein